MSEPDPTTLGSSVTIVRWWQAWDTEHDEFVTFRWENEGWTIEGRLPQADVDYVMRLGSDGEVRQFMLFRDLDEPDLWLAHDGRGTWGEMNGAARPDLDGCLAVGPTHTMLSLSLPIRRLGVWAADNEASTTKLGLIDVELSAWSRRRPLLCPLRGERRHGRSSGQPPPVHRSMPSPISTMTFC